jgi:hypothetical protein
MIKDRTFNAHTGYFGCGIFDGHCQNEAKLRYFEEPMASLLCLYSSVTASSADQLSHFLTVRAENSLVFP